MKYVKGDLVQMAKAGQFDVIAHGCNCFCAMGAGIAPIMARNFGADTFKLEQPAFKGSYNKLGTIDYQKVDNSTLIVVNAYTQYRPGRDLDYDALALCLKKIALEFPNQKIGLPFIGAGLAGGDPHEIYTMMDMYSTATTTLVIFEDHLYDLVEQIQ